MEIMELPESLRPAPKIAYPPYSTGTKNIEEYFYHFITNSALGTLHSEFIYVPAFWTHYYIQHNFGRDPMPEHDELMARIIKSDKKYFTVVQYDDGILKNTPPNLVVFSAGHNGHKNIPIPLLADGFPAGQIREQHQREHLICFAGSMETHHVRKKMADYFRGKPGVVFAENLPVDEYAELMQNSIYTLCPRGYGVTSFRLYEALKCGSIPVYISDKNTNFHIPEEFKNLMVKAEVRDMMEDGIYNWLGNVVQVGGAQNAFDRIRKSQHLLTMEHTAKTIIQTFQL